MNQVKNHEIIYRIKSKNVQLLIDDSSEDKKAKVTKKPLIKIKFKFENHKNCLESTQLKTNINHLEKNETNVDSLKNIIKN